MIFFARCCSTFFSPRLFINESGIEREVKSRMRTLFHYPTVVRQHRVICMQKNEKRFASGLITTFVGNSLWHWIKFTVHYEYVCMFEFVFTQTSAISSGRFIQVCRPDEKLKSEQRWVNKKKIESLNDEERKINNESEKRPNNFGPNLRCLWKKEEKNPNSMLCLAIIYKRIASD